MTNHRRNGLTLDEMRNASAAYEEVCIAILEERRPNTQHAALGSDWAHGIEFGPRWKTRMIARVNQRFNDWINMRSPGLGIADLVTTNVYYR